MGGEIFRPDKSLSNPKFEGYKLHIIPQEEAVLQFPIANRPTQAATSGKVPLTFQEVQSRITHNHLAVHSESGRAVFIDADYNVTLVVLGQDMLSPLLRTIFQLPRPIQTAEVDMGVHREYPSAFFLDSTSLLASDGQGTMYILKLGDPTQNEAATLFGTWSLPSGLPGTINAPFRVHQVHQLSSSCVIAALSSRSYSPVQQEAALARHHPPVEFDVWGVKIIIGNAQPDTTSVPVEVLWHRRGKDVPFYVNFDDELGLHLLLGGSEYRRLDVPPLPTYEPTSDEIVPISSIGESFLSSDAPPKPAPYSWTQTSDSVTIAIPVPSKTPKDRIKVMFSSTTLTLHVDSGSESPASEAISFPPKFPAKKLWDEIVVSSSFWTFDREAERTYGVLSLHLEKRNEGTKWSQVFESVGTGPITEVDIEVPETLDPSELWNIREALEKYTTALQSEGASGLGFGKGVPSLADNELDEEVDSSVGRHTFMTWVSDPSRRTQPEFLSQQEYSTPFQLLSTPIPGFADPVSLIVKTNIDGNLFKLEDMIDVAKAPKWSHEATYPALAFVLASKRDTRFIHHVPGQAVFAFESGSNMRGGNVYIYYFASPQARTAKQSILKINDGRGGALMGVGSVRDREGKIVIVCLTEGELTLIRDV